MPVLTIASLLFCPCVPFDSGDGTMRKNPEVWRKWSSANGNGLHRYDLIIRFEPFALHCSVVFHS